MVIDNVSCRGFVAKTAEKIANDLPSVIRSLCEDAFDHNGSEQTTLVYRFDETGLGSHTFIQSDLRIIQSTCLSVIGRYEPDDLHGYRVELRQIRYVVRVDDCACLEIVLRTTQARSWEDEELD